MKLALLRHGPTEWNALGRIQGHIDIPLSDAGLVQMKALSPPPSFADARPFASPLRRARQTAEALGLACPVLDSRLMEQNWGRWEGLSRAEILALDGQDAFARAGHALDFRPPGGESTRELHERVASFLKDAAMTAQHERVASFLKDAAMTAQDAIAVTHLGVLRAAYTLATGWDMASPMPADLDVSKVLILALMPDGKPAIQALNVELRARG